MLFEMVIFTLIAKKSKGEPKGEIIAYDFGIMGFIDEYTRRVYAEILYGFIRGL